MMRNLQSSVPADAAARNGPQPNGVLGRLEAKIRPEKNRFVLI